MSRDPMQQMFSPKQYQNISELLGVLGNLLIVGEKSEDPEFRKRYLQLFDVMFKGLALYVDKEFYQTGAGVPVSLKRPENTGGELPEFIIIEEPVSVAPLDPAS